ncbi:F-box only protein 47 [Nematostella vectensis]|nr:F-box only protein 47 [Nematostella vectensis]
MAANICKFMRSVKHYKTRRTNNKKTQNGGRKEFGAFGIFSLIPQEMCFRVYAALPLVELGNLALTSRALRDSVLFYLHTKQGIVSIVPRLLDVPSRIEDELKGTDLAGKAIQYMTHFGELGILTKRVSCLLSTKERLREVGIILDKLKDTHMEICLQFGSDFAYSCYGEFLHVFVAGWEDDEKLRAYQAIKAGASCLDERMHKVLHTAPGSHPWFERYIRVFCREIFLDKASDRQEKLFWLTSILKPWPIVCKARLLYIIYGPVFNESGFINWDIMTTCPTFYGVEDAVLRELSEALEILDTEHSSKWNEDDLVSVIEELTAIPSDWCLENIAKMLKLCGDSISFAVLGSKAVNGRVHELSYLGYYTAQAAGHDDMVNGKGRKIESFMSLIKRLLATMPGYKNKISFATSLFNVWEENVLTLAEEMQIAGAGRDESPEEQEQALISTVHSLSRVAAFLLKDSIL